jgi:hypothetical protein
MSKVLIYQDRQDHKKNTYHIKALFFAILSLFYISHVYNLII